MPWRRETRSILELSASPWCFTARQTTTATGRKSESSMLPAQRQSRLHERAQRPSARLSGFRCYAQEEEKHHKHGQEHLVHNFLPPQITMVRFYPVGCQQSRGNCFGPPQNHKNLRRTLVGDAKTRVSGTLLDVFFSEFRSVRDAMSRHRRGFDFSCLTVRFWGKRDPVLWCTGANPMRFPRITRIPVRARHRRISPNSLG